MRRGRLPLGLSCGLLAWAIVAGAPLAGVQAGFDRSESLRADTLVVRNVVGQVEIEGHDGPDFEVEVLVRGRDASPDRVQVEVRQGPLAEVIVRFPLEESKRYVYPRSQGTTSISLDDGASWLSRLLGGGSIKVSSDGQGLEIWADVTLRVPRGKKLVVDHGVGTLHARNVVGDLELATRSGAVGVSGVTGGVSIDTGSGQVTVTGIGGDLHVDTGSGRVAVSEVRSKKLHLDTGSGRVELAGVDSSSIHVDTGSGGVEGQAVGADDLTIDTGSGSVTLDLARMGRGKFLIDTGSGSIDLRLPAAASAEVRADTGSGGIHLDLAGEVRMREQGDDMAEFTVGAGDARVRLDTGSGTIHVRQ